MQRTAIYWLVYIKTNSPFMLGMTVFISQIPSFLLSPVGGIVSDRYNRYRVMLTTQIASMLQALLLFVIVAFTKYQLWEIFLLSGFLGVINAFDVPARQALIHDIIGDKNLLSNAIALNSSMVNLAWLVGPVLAGFILKYWGADQCFLLNSISFIAVICSLLCLKLPAYKKNTNKKESYFTDFKAGFDYLIKNPNIGIIILYIASVSLLILPFSTLLPIYAKTILHGDSSTFGYLNGGIGIGAICGTLFIASIKTTMKLRKVLIINLIIFGIGLICFSYSNLLYLNLLFCLLCGIGMVSQTTICNTIIQTSSSMEMRGRIISFFAMAFFGMQTLGGLLIGSVSHLIGGKLTILLEGIVAILLALVFYSKIIKKSTI